MNTNPTANDLSTVMLSVERLQEIVLRLIETSHASPRTATRARLDANAAQTAILNAVSRIGARNGTSVS